MPLQLCPKCNRMHYTTDKCQVAQKSTAARMDVQLSRGDAAQVSLGNVGEPSRKAAGQAYKTQAGTQALPVDTIPKPKRKDIRKRQGDRHKPGYYPEYRQRKKASQPHQTETER